MKKISVVLSICVLLSIAVSFPSFSQREKQNNGFDDVSSDFWAKEAISWMAKENIIKGYEDNTFRPQNDILRAEFATILVKSLKLEQIKPEEGTFVDIPKDNWMYCFVETAKSYLTGFRVGGIDYFRPKETAVREDMAVAVVKAKALTIVEDTSILNSYEDKDYISPNLAKFVATAIKNGIMIGQKTDKGTMIFKPQEGITRAEAAQLLYNVVKKDLGEKIVYDAKPNDKPNSINPTNQQTGSFTLKAGSSGSKIDLEWNPQPGNGFNYYKVVASINKENPKYPEDGYLTYISDPKQTKFQIYAGQKYNGGDFGGVIKAGVAYKFSITAVYSENKKYSNTVTLTLSATTTTSCETTSCETTSCETTSSKTTSSKTPVLQAVKGDVGIKLHWSKVLGEGFNYYKVVISELNPQPSYPESGYLTYITDVNNVYYNMIGDKGYNGGDFGGVLEKGHKYYFAITAVYNEGKYTSNVVQLEY